MIWKEDKLGLGKGMFEGDSLSGAVRFKFRRADSLQNKTRTEEIRNRREKEVALSLT